jgi:hypothetical protein
LELNNKGDYPFIQPLCRGLCSASRLRFGHSTDPPLNFLSPDAQSSKRLDPEGLVAPLVQTLQLTRYENDSGAGLNAAFKASCSCARRVSLASRVRKLRNGSPLVAFGLCSMGFGAATEVVDKAATVSHAISCFESIIDVSALPFPVSVEVDPEQT